MRAKVAAQAESLPDERFRHEALFYAGDDQFVEACVAFIRAGLEAAEPTLVVALADKLEKLRGALGPDAERVQFADMDVVGRNPARIIPAWQEFVEWNAAPGANPPPRGRVSWRGPRARGGGCAGGGSRSSRPGTRTSSSSASGMRRC